MIAYMYVYTLKAVKIQKNNGPLNQHLQMYMYIVHEQYSSVFLRMRRKDLGLSVIPWLTEGQQHCVSIQTLLY